MAENVRAHLLKDDLATVRFEPERHEESAESFALSASVPLDSASAVDCALELDDLIKEIRSS
jgi:hypothetical protein